MKRTQLRRRGLKRPRWEDVTLRNAYADANQYDEIASLFPDYAPGLVGIDFDGLITPIEPGIGATDTHHICGGVLGARRWDRIINLIRTCRVTHLWCEKYQRPGFALCAVAKIRKGEWDWEEMAGYMLPEGGSVMGWLESGPHEFEWPMELLLKTMRERT